jgi:hypothetical protein
MPMLSIRNGLAPVGIENRIEGLAMVIICSLLYFGFKMYNEPTAVIFVVEANLTRF